MVVSVDLSADSLDRSSVDLSEDWWVIVSVDLSADSLDGSSVGSLPASRPVTSACCFSS